MSNQSYVSQARLFATEYAKNAAANMMQTIREVTKNSGRITKIALGVSMPHQIGYILALAVPHMTWDVTGNPSGVLESATMIMLAFGVPVGTDLMILNCIKVIGAAAASRGSKRLAICLMMGPVTASCIVNFLAPAPMLIKVLAAFIVTVIPMSESLRAFVKPDFAKIEAMEVQIAAQVSAAPVVIARRKKSPARHKIEAILSDAPETTIQELAKAAKTGYNNAHRIRKEYFDAQAKLAGATA